MLSKGAENLKFFAENCANLGRGEALAGRWTGVVKPEKSSLRGEAADGWQFPQGEQSMTAQKLANYERDFARLQQTPQRFETGDSVSEEALHKTVAKLVKNRVTPVLIIPPTVAPKRFLPIQLTTPPLVIFDFSDPQKYPDFFTPEHRLDGVHLNVAGSELFTTTLAERFSELASAGAP